MIGSINRLAKINFCQSHFIGKNFLTPHVLGYFRNKRYIVEVSSSRTYTTNHKEQIINKTTQSLGKRYPESIVLAKGQAMTALYLAFDQIHKGIALTVYDRDEKCINHTISELCVNREEFNSVLKQVGVNVGLFIPIYVDSNTKIIKNFK